MGRKNHSVNRERSIAAQKRHRRLKARQQAAREQRLETKGQALRYWRNGDVDHPWPSTPQHPSRRLVAPPVGGCNYKQIKTLRGISNWAVAFATVMELAKAKMDERTGGTADGQHGAG